MTNYYFYRRGAFSLLVLSLFTACGPSCPEIKAALDVAGAVAEDVTRLNALVAKRSAAIEEAETGATDNFRLKRLKFSVTAYELAIETQVRIIKASPKFDDSTLYEEYGDMINRIRCSYAKILETEDHITSDKQGREIQTIHANFEILFKNEAAVSKYELKEYFENGIRKEQ